MNSPEKRRVFFKNKVAFKDVSAWATAKQCPLISSLLLFSDLHRNVQRTDLHSTWTNTTTTTTRPQHHSCKTSTWESNTRVVLHNESGNGRQHRAGGGGEGAVSTGFVQGTLEVGSLWSCCIPQCTQV